MILFLLEAVSLLSLPGNLINKIFLLVQEGLIQNYQVGSPDL